MASWQDLKLTLPPSSAPPPKLGQTFIVLLTEFIFVTSESVTNAELMQKLNLVPKLLFVLQDASVTDSTAHTIASVLSVLLSNTSEKKNLLRYETGICYFH